VFPMALRASLGRTGRSHALAVLARLEQRAPSSRELAGDANGIRRNLTLQAEKTRSVSLVHSVKRRGWNLQSTAFWNLYEQPIRLAPYGATQFLRYENGADYRAIGLEASGKADHRFAEAALSLTLQELSIREGLAEGNWPAYQSPVEAHAEFFLKPFRNAKAGAVLDFRGAYYPGDANIADSRRPQEWEWGAHAEAAGGGARLALDARNLLDRQYRDFAYSPRSGRSYSVTLSLNL
jgi:outer membrane receptor protein involved in Fe transport